MAEKLRDRVNNEIDRELRGQQDAQAYLHRMRNNELSIQDIETINQLKQVLSTYLELPDFMAISDVELDGLNRTVNDIKRIAVAKNQKTAAVEKLLRSIETLAATNRREDLEEVKMRIRAILN